MPMRTRPEAGLAGPVSGNSRMASSPQTASGCPIPVHLYRDPDPRVAALPGMDLGPARADGDPVAVADRWFGDGARRVVLPEPVDISLDDPASVPVDMVRRLALVRELTGCGAVVDWRLRLAGGGDERLWLLSHLYPPAEVWLDGAGAGRAARQTPQGTFQGPLSGWREGFYLGRCCYRRGPTFLQIHDGRDGRSGTFVVDDPAQVATISGWESGEGPPASGGRSGERVARGLELVGERAFGQALEGGIDTDALEGADFGPVQRRARMLGAEA